MKQTSDDIYVWWLIHFSPSDHILGNARTKTHIIFLFSTMETCYHDQINFISFLDIFTSFLVLIHSFVHKKSGKADVTVFSHHKSPQYPNRIVIWNNWFCHFMLKDNEYREHRYPPPNQRSSKYSNFFPSPTTPLLTISGFMLEPFLASFLAKPCAARPN